MFFSLCLLKKELQNAAWVEQKVSYWVISFVSLSESGTLMKHKIPWLFVACPKQRLSDLYKKKLSKQIQKELARLFLDRLLYPKCVITQITTVVIMVVIPNISINQQQLMEHHPKLWVLELYTSAICKYLGDK